MIELKKSVKFYRVSLLFKAFVYSGLFIVAGSSILFTRKIIWKGDIIEKSFIIILLSYAVTNLILCF